MARAGVMGHGWVVEARRTLVSRTFYPIKTLPAVQLGKQPSLFCDFTAHLLLSLSDCCQQLDPNGYGAPTGGFQSSWRMYRNSPEKSRPSWNQTQEKLGRVKLRAWRRIHCAVWANLGGVGNTRTALIGKQNVSIEVG